MVVIAFVAGAALMIWFFAALTASYAREAVITGLVWLFMNWILDMIVLVGILRMAPLDYVSEIGIWYLMIPVMIISAGVVADCDLERNRP